MGEREDVIKLREILDLDGHLVENAVSMIAATVAAGTAEFTDDLEGMLAKTAAEKGSTKIPSSLANTLTALAMVIEHNRLEIVQVSISASLRAPDADRAKLVRALQAGNLAVLRAVALDLEVPSENVPTTLREKIKSLS